MCVTRFISLSSPEAVEWDEDAAVAGAGVGVGGEGMISGEDLVADEFSQVISSVFWASSAWLLISQPYFFATSLSTPLSSVRCAEGAGFFLEDRRLSR